MFEDFEITLGREIFPQILKQVDLGELAGDWSEKDIKKALDTLRKHFGHENVDMLVFYFFGELIRQKRIKVTHRVTDPEKDKTKRDKYNFYEQEEHRLSLTDNREDIYSWIEFLYR